jgi:hypothetical protein
MGQCDVARDTAEDQAEAIERHNSERVSSLERGRPKHSVVTGFNGAAFDGDQCLVNVREPGS